MERTGSISSNPTGTSLSRYLQAIGRADTKNQALSFSQDWPDSPSVSLTLKSEVSPGTTSSLPFVAYGLASEYVSAEYGVSVIGALAPKMRRVPFYSSV